MSSVFEWLNKSGKRSKSTKSSSAPSLVPLDRTASSPATSSFLHERFKRPKLKSTKTAPGTLCDLPEETSSSQTLISSLTHADGAGISNSAAAHTALNVFKLALVTLSSASDNLPVPGVKVAVDVLLTVIDGVQVSHEMLAVEISYSWQRVDGPGERSRIPNFNRTRCAGKPPAVGLARC
jgi:hypothetical protein